MLPKGSYSGRLRHLSCRVLWLQALVASGTVKLCSASGQTNPADIGTKRLTAARLRSLMVVLGLFNQNSNALAGSDDQGKVFIKKHNVRALLCTLSLLNLQGCEVVEPLESTWNLMAFTLLLGLLMIVPLIFSWFSISTCAGRDVTLDEVSSTNDPVVSEPRLQVIPTTAPPASLGSAMADAALMPVSTSEASSSNASLPLGVEDSGMLRFNNELELPVPMDVWSPEAILTWMYERCLRRRDAAETDAKRALYEERLAVLREVMQACRSGDPNTRWAASQMTRTMSDFSEDENSPAAEQSVIQLTNTLEDAERVFEVVQQLANTLRGASSSGAASSAQVNAVADAMTNMLTSQENAEEEEQSESDIEMETGSERMR
eukprot:s242_g33.t1